MDDHVAVRHGLALVLAEEGVGECREASAREEALAAAAREFPDMALVDLSPATEEALALVAELSKRNIPVLVCSMHEEASYLRRALAAGARGYITKPEAPQELAHAVCDPPRVCAEDELASPYPSEGIVGKPEVNPGWLC